MDADKCDAKQLQMTRIGVDQVRPLGCEGRMRRRSETCLVSGRTLGNEYKNERKWTEIYRDRKGLEVIRTFRKTG